MKYCLVYILLPLYVGKYYVLNSLAFTVGYSDSVGVALNNCGQLPIRQSGPTS